MKRYDEDKIKSLLEDVEAIPGNVYTILKLIMSTNLGINEILYLEKECLKLDEEGYYICFKNRDDLFIRHMTTDKLECSISDEIAELLHNQIEETNKKFPDSKYIFAVSNEEVYNTNLLRNDIKKIPKIGNIRVSDGNIFTQNRYIKDDASIYGICEIAKNEKAIKECTGECLACKNFIAKNEKIQTYKEQLKK